MNAARPTSGLTSVGIPSNSLVKIPFGICKSVFLLPYIVGTKTNSTSRVTEHRHRDEAREILPRYLKKSTLAEALLADFKDTCTIKLSEQLHLEELVVEQAFDATWLMEKSTRIAEPLIPLLQET